MFAEERILFHHPYEARTNVDGAKNLHAGTYEAKQM